MKYSAHSVSQKRQSRAQGEQCCIFIFPAVQEIFSFLRIKTLFSVLPRESYLTDVSSNKVLCSAFSVEQRYLKIRRFKSLDFTKLITLITTCITSLNADESSLEVEASRWMMQLLMWMWGYFLWRMLRYPIFLPIIDGAPSMQHSTTRSQSNWFSEKKVSITLKYRALLLSNATSSNKEVLQLCNINMQICHTLTTVLLT